MMKAIHCLTGVLGVLATVLVGVTANTNTSSSGPRVEIRYNNTVITDSTYTFQFINTKVAYTNGEHSGSGDKIKYKVYVPALQYVPGRMGYQPKSVEVRLRNCNLGVNQMIIYDSPVLTETPDLTNALYEDPEHAHLVTQASVANNTYSVNIEPGQCYIALSYYAGFAVDTESGGLVVETEGNVTCTVEFAGSEETKMVSSLFMFLGTLFIIVLPAILVFILGLFVKPREDESKTSVGYQKRLRSSTTCMYILAFVLCFAAFCALLVVSLL